MLTTEEISKIWDQFDIERNKVNPDKKVLQDIKNQLVVEYYDLVKSVAERMAAKLSEISVDECVSYGIDGLYEAIEKYERSRGVKFKTFAPYRIRGAILDNIRKADWVPRLARQRDTLIKKHRQSYYKEHGIYPSETELADILNMSVEDLIKISRKSVPISVMSMNSNSADNVEGDDFSNIVTVKDAGPINKMLRREMFQKFMGRNFTKLERKIVFLHYYEGKTMKEIAEELNFSESRISQMHTDVIKRLREKVGRNPNYAADLEMMFQS